MLNPDRRAEYLQHAQLARQQADKAVGDDLREGFLRLAVGWEHLAASLPRPSESIDMLLQEELGQPVGGSFG